MAKKYYTQAVKTLGLFTIMKQIKKCSISLDVKIYVNDNLKGIVSPLTDDKLWHQMMWPLLQSIEPLYMQIKERMR